MILLLTQTSPLLLVTFWHLPPAESVLESEVETDEANPDKATYQPDAVSNDDSLSSLATVPILKMSYAEVVSPKCKGKAVTGTKAALATKPAEQASMKMKVVEPSMSDSAMELHFPPLSPTQPKASMSTKTKPTVQQTTTKRKAVEAPVSDSAMEPNSPLLMPSQPKASSKFKGQKTSTSKKRVDTVPGSDSPPTTAPSQALNPKTLAPLKSKWKRVASPEVSDTEPDSPPPKPKQRTLQQLKSHCDLGDIDKTLRKPAAVPKQEKLGSRVVDSSKAKDKGSEAKG